MSNIAQNGRVGSDCGVRLYFNQQHYGDSLVRALLQELLGHRNARFL